MKTKLVHLIVIIGTYAIALAPLIIFIVVLTTNYNRYKSCKSFEDYAMLCAKLEEENFLLDYNIFYNKALVKKEELYPLFVEDSIASIEIVTCESTNNFTMDDNRISSLLHNPDFDSYYNYRFDFHITYPSFLIAGDEPLNGDGRVFYSTDNSIILRATGINNVFDESIEDKYYENDIASVTYSRLKDNWFVISDYTSDNRIFYQKTVLYNNAFVTATLIFPVEYKNEFDPIIKRISTTFPH